MAVVMIVSGVGGLFLTSGTASADVDSVEGTGFGISVSVAGTFVIPPSPDPTQNPPRLVANEQSTDFGPHVASIITIGGVLGILDDGISVGPVATQAANIVGENHLGSIGTSSQVANISALNDAIEIPLIVSNCVANGDGVTSSVNVSNARIGPSTLLNGPVNPTTIDVLGLATVRLHERIIENVPPSGGNPGRTRITVNGARISIPADGSIAEIILAQSVCEAIGPDVLAPPTTTATTAPPTTAGPGTTAPPTTAGPGTTAPPTTAGPGTTAPPTTAGPGTTAPPTTAGPTTVAPTTAPPTTAPPSGTLATTTLAPTVTTAPPGVLVRTGQSLQPLAVLSGVSIVLGILMLIGSGRPLTANASGGTAIAGTYPGAGPEKWGPVEIGRTIWAGFATLIVGITSLFSGRRRRNE